jgi:hypothetical protein
MAFAHLQNTFAVSSICDPDKFHHIESVLDPSEIFWGASLCSRKPEICFALLGAAFLRIDSKKEA